MNPMQQMLQQAQKMQRELKKAHDELDAKEFTSSKSGMVTVKATGNRQIVSIDIDKEALDEENKEMLEDAIKLAINEINEQISKESDEIEEKVTGKTGLYF